MKEVTYEAAIKSLEEIIKRLERGDLPLEETIKLYEEGMKLSAECTKRLEAAEAKIKILTGGAEEENA